MEIVTIISEHKKNHKVKPVKRGHKRVQAIVREEGGALVTRHIDVPK